jgi:hypothetical protein
MLVWRDNGGVMSEHKILQEAINDRIDDYRDAFDWLENHAPDEAREDAREALELVRCLRRALPHLTAEQVHAAFGAPGDFGYNTPVGNALARLYRGES